jgi:hypothetical protein
MTKKRDGGWGSALPSPFIFLGLLFFFNRAGDYLKSAREFPSPLGDRDDSAVICLGIPQYIA